MPIDLEMLRYTDNKAVSKGPPTNAVIAALKNVERPTTTRNIHPKDNNIIVTTSGDRAQAKVLIYTDGSKTENHVGAGMTVMEDSKEIYFEARRLSLHCTVYQAELYGINMAMEWIETHPNRPHTIAIHVDSKAALLTIKDKQTTHPLAAKIRTKVINLRNSSQISFHWVKGHAGLKGNERADYLAKIAASYIHVTSYNAVPRSLGKKMLEDYYIQIWNATYTNSGEAAQTKLFIPTIPHRLSLSLWPNYVLTQFLTNHGSFRHYLFKMNKTPSPHCNCPESPVQTAIHLLTECTLFSRDRPAVLENVPLPWILKHHINTVTVTNFIQRIFNKLRE
jgi:ribonuclease HI